MVTQATPQSPLQAVIHDYEAKGRVKFSPTTDFYEDMGINRIRFWQLVRGKKEPLASELLKLSEFFSVSLTTLCAK